MNFDKFTDGNHFSIGVELELRILNRFSLSLENEYDYIVENIDEKYKKNLACEFLNSMVEINTPIFNYEKDLLEYLKHIIAKMDKIAKKKSLCLQTSGSYAQENSNVKVNENERYEELFEEHQILLQNFSICGTHIHIGFEDFDKALKAYNYSIYYLPLFVALSASSVFFNNTNSGIHSYRTKIFDRLPKASIPDYFDSFEDMKKLYDILYDSKVITSGKDIWWDVRIQPKFKTVEFRVCDAIHDFDRLETIISLAKGVCQLSQVKKLEKYPMQILKQNMWSATRHSMDGSMITNNGLKSIKEVLKELNQELLDFKFITKETFDKNIIIIEKDSISQEMIKVYNRTKSLKEVERLGVFI